MNTHTAVMIASYRVVLAERRFRRLLVGLVLSYVGDGLSVVTVAWLAIELAPPGRTELLVGSAVAAYTLPAAVGAVALARFLRGVRAPKLIVGNAVLRGGCLGAAAIAHLAGWLSPVAYVVLLGVSALLSAWGSAGTYTLISEVFEPERRLAANALVGTAMSGAVVLGPAMAGLLLTVVDAALVLALDALTFLVLAMQVIRTRWPQAPTERTPPGSGFRLLARHRHLLGLVVATAVFYFVYGPVEVALPLFVIDEIGASAGLLATYWTAFGAGAIVGGLLGGLLSRARMWPFVVGVVAGWGLALVPFGWSDSPVLTVACFAFGGLVYGPFPAFSTTLFQSAAPSSELPSLLAAKSAVTVAAPPLGAILGAPAVALWGPGGTLFASGAVTVGLAAAMVLVLLAARAR